MWSSGNRTIGERSMSDEEGTLEASAPAKQEAVVVRNESAVAAETQPSGTPEPESTQYSYGGKTFSVSSELKEALDKRDSDYSRGYNKSVSELTELKQQQEVQQTQPQPTYRQDEVLFGGQTPQAGTYDYSTALIDNPNEAVKRIEDSAVARVRQEMYAREKEKSKIDNRRDLLSKIQANNADLRGNETFVKAVFDQELALAKQSNNNMPLEEFEQRVVDKTRSSLQTYVNNLQGSSGGQTTVIEGQRNTTGTTSVPDTGPLSMSDMLSNMNAARLSQ